MASNKKTLSQEEVERIFLKQGLQVLEPYINSRTRIQAKCLGCGKIVQPFYRQIWSGQSGCRDCSSNKFRLTEEEVSLTLQKVGLKLIGEYKNSKDPVEVECLKCGTVLKVALSSIRNTKEFHCTGCNPKRSFLRRKTLAEGELKELNKTFLEHHFELIGSYRSVNRPVLVRHITCGTESERSLKSIKTGAGFCKGCTKNRVLTEVEALEVLDEAGFEPIGKFVNVDTPWESRCKKCGKILTPTIHTLKSKGSGCAYCNGVRVDPDDAVKLMISAGYIPLEPYRNNKVKWKSEHEVCGKVVYPMYNSIQNGQGGCTDCADKYSYFETSYFYVMEHEAFQSLKIGISNTESKDDRVIVHSKHGWKLLQRIDFENGFLAYEFEQTLLKHLRITMKIPVHLSKAEMPQSGFSETFSIETISKSSLLKLVRANQSGTLTT
jgi:ribosomal protein S27E